MSSASEAEIIEAINPILEARWSQKQLAKGKWFEIQQTWPSVLLKSVSIKYRKAGWHVNRMAELTQGKTRVYLVIGHPGYFMRGF